MARAKDRFVLKYMVDAYKAAEKIVLMLFLQACKVFVILSNSNLRSKTSSSSSCYGLRAVVMGLVYVGLSIANKPLQNNKPLLEKQY